MKLLDPSVAVAENMNDVENTGVEAMSASDLSFKDKDVESKVGMMKDVKKSDSDHSVVFGFGSTSLSKSESDIISRRIRRK